MIDIPTCLSALAMFLSFLLAVLITARRRGILPAPPGYEDKSGFHVGDEPEEK
jgi:hypothetical protein